MALEVPPPEALPPIAAPPRAVGWISLALLFVSVCFAVGGQFTLKIAMERIGRIGVAQVKTPTDTIWKAASEPRLWLGLFLFGVSALFWLVVLSRVDLSLAYPMVGLSYIVVVFVAKVFLHEHVPPLRWVGALVVAIGIAIIGISFRRASGA